MEYFDYSSVESGVYLHGTVDAYVWLPHVVPDNVVKVSNIIKYIINMRFCKVVGSYNENNFIKRA